MRAMKLVVNLLAAALVVAVPLGAQRPPSTASGVPGIPDGILFPAGGDIPKNFSVEASADDYINPPELGIAEKLVKRVPHARFILLPISDATRGHGTHTAAAVWKDYLAEFLRETEPKH